jgi:type I restriction enzyme R subunit
MDKKALNETEIRTQYITPALCRTWDLATQVREEFYFTRGRVIVRGKTVKRGTPKKADYLLFYKPGIPLALVEAKDNHHAPGAGMQQGLEYGEILDVPFVYSSNGDSFIEHDRTGGSGAVEREIPLDQFPSPAELWARYAAVQGLTPEQESVAVQDYHDDASGKLPRYYQLIAINRTVEAVARGRKRLLLVMATGTGKTYTAFQIIWRLWKSGARKRILFLVDRNVLADQTKTNDFKPFGQAMTKITNRRVDKSYEIYLALYQAVTGTEEKDNIYRQFSPDFFDLVIVDECHRGSAAEDAAWREVLEYFSSATQIGLTATPKETRDVSNISYFGEPIYTYSLKQGISDGYLAPYKVVRIGIDRDLEGWRPEAGKLDKYGNLIEDREYGESDFDRTLILEPRTELVAARVSEFLKATDRFAKTIIFCETVEAAERMRGALVNENADLAAKNPRYVMKITGDDEAGKAQLDNFIDPESPYPVIAVTSQLMSTGVDAQTCKLIVLDKRIRSMTEFKQIIGRGTRIREDYGKLYFTIMDFRRATALFADPDFDGEPVQIYEPRPDEPPVPPDPPDDAFDPGAEGGEGVEGGDGFPDPGGLDGDAAGGAGGGAGGPTRYYVDDVEVKVISERVQYLGADGKLITEALSEYARKAVRSSYASLTEFLTDWTATERKIAILDELAERGVFFDDLAGQVPNGTELDPFDLVCHVAFDQPPLTRRERAEQVRKRNVFGKYGDRARAVLEALLEKYADTGLRSVESREILRVPPLRDLGTPVEIIGLFGGKEQYRAAIHELEAELYSKDA